MSTNFKKGSAFRSDQFVNQDDNFTSDEVKDLKKKDFNSKYASQIQSEKDKHFVETMESDRAAEFIKDTEEQKIKNANKLKEEAANYVELSDSISSYKVNLAEWGMWTLMQKKFPKEYEYHCVPTKPGSLNIYGKRFETKDGIIFVLKDTKGSVYVKAMALTLDTWVDVTAIQLLAVEVENTVDMCEGILEKEKNDVVDKAVSKILDSNGKPL